MFRNLFLLNRPLMCAAMAVKPQPSTLSACRTLKMSPMLLDKQCGAGKVPPKLANLMKEYQKNDGKPVFLKGGSKDDMLFKLTLVLCGIGLAGNIWLYLGYIIA